jgi:hypothetical protein
MPILFLACCSRGGAVKRYRRAALGAATESELALLREETTLICFDYSKYC